MIFRKPYAFIIKHFRKIHVLLLVCAIYIYFKNTQTLSFVNEFIATNSYNPMIESIRDYTSFLLFFLLFVVIAISFVLMDVLHYKKKPWKAYLLPFLSYIFLFIVMMSTSNFFNHYGEDSTLVAIRTLSQLLQMASLFQYAVFLLLFIRITGLDLKKFDFRHDQEYLDIKEEDREEFEVNIEVDKDSVLRFLKKQKRHAKYLYMEHPFVINTLFALIALGLLGYTYYYFGIYNKVYHQKDTFQALSYAITVKESYFTKTDYKGDVVNEGKEYVVVLLHVKNLGTKRTLNVDRFRLLNKGNFYTYTNLENTSFQDLGGTYPTRELAKGEEASFKLVFEVAPNLSNKHFVLYYQDIIGTKKLHYRKVKLNPVDLHQIKTIASKKINEKMAISGVAVSKKEIELTGAAIKDEAIYTTLSCTLQNCSVVSAIARNSGGKILVLSFDTTDFEDKDFVDFSTNYGIIEYKDNKGKSKRIKIRSAVEGEYIGKKIFIKVPADIEGATSMQLIYTIRNKAYAYKIK